MGTAVVVAEVVGVGVHWVDDAAAVEGHSLSGSSLAETLDQK